MARYFCSARTQTGARCKRQAWKGKDGVGSMFCLQHKRIEEELDDRAARVGEKIRRLMEPWWF